MKVGVAQTDYEHFMNTPNIHGGNILLNMDTLLGLWDHQTSSGLLDALLGTAKNYMLKSPKEYTSMVVRSCSLKYIHFAQIVIWLELEQVFHVFSTIDIIIIMNIITYYYILLHIVTYYYILLLHIITYYCITIIINYHYYHLFILC